MSSDLATKPLMTGLAFAVYTPSTLFSKTVFPHVKSDCVKDRLPDRRKAFVEQTVVLNPSLTLLVAAYETYVIGRQTIGP